MNTTQDDGGPAFPMQGNPEDRYAGYLGMSLRDWFAGMALAESIRLCAKADKENSDGTTQEFINMATNGEPDINTLEAKMAYAFADAMLAARKEQP